MRMLNKTHYGYLPNRTKEGFEEMCQCQNMALLDPNGVIFVAAAEASDRWNKLASIEESSFVRSPVSGGWELETITQFSSRNTIKILVNEAGETLTKLSDIKKEVVQHF